MVLTFVGQAFGGHAKDERSKPKVDPTPKEKIPLKKGGKVILHATCGYIMHVQYLSNGLGLRGNHKFQIIRN